MSIGKFEDIYLGPNGCPRWRAAVCMTCLFQGHYIAPTDVLNMPRSLKFIQTADGLMQQGRDSLKNVDDALSQLGDLDIRLAAHVQKKPLIG